jgi:hypothetical protein
MRRREKVSDEMKGERKNSNEISIEIGDPTLRN